MFSKSKQSINVPGSTTKTDGSASTNEGDAMTADNTTCANSLVSRRKSTTQLLAFNRSPSKDIELGSKDSDSLRSGQSGQSLPSKTALSTGLVVILGVVAASLFIGYSLASSRREQKNKFEIRAAEVVHDFEAAWEEYENASRWLHQACTIHPMTLQEFRDVYEYLTVNLEVLAAEWVPKVMHEDRGSLEEESRVFYEENYPDIEYVGIKGFEPDPEHPKELTVQKRSNQTFYYPIHLVEPVQTNTPVVGLDLYSIESRRKVLDIALESWKPAISKPLEILQKESDETWDTSILLTDPGIPLSSHPDLEPKDLATLEITTKSLLKRATRGIRESISVFLYDTTDRDGDDPAFIIAAELHVHEDTGMVETFFLDEIPLYDLTHTNSSIFKKQINVQVAQAEWIIEIVALEGTFTSNSTYIFFAGGCILVACFCIALWMFTNIRRMKAMQSMRMKTSAEKAAMIVKSARNAAKMEQELNDYIAHEVRNPLAAAMSACTFVKTAVERGGKAYFKGVESSDEEDPMQTVVEDMDIIDSSLSFINDLLRSMLDMHKASSKKIQVKLAPLDLKKDILQPVAAMLYKRDSEIQVYTECPDHLVVSSDRLRLKQIILNLGRNSTKFVQKGYIRLGAFVAEDGDVRIFIEDTGPGISKDKRSHLFAKFQESLDSLDQGTGMGLCLCKNMVDLLEGSIGLDESFDSGVEGCPGTKFMINLKTPPIAPEEYNALLDSLSAPTSTSVTMTGDIEENRNSNLHPTQSMIELPETLSVLFVDDDLVLRKLFTRSVRKVAKEWDIDEASNGETALKLVEDQTFDIIFMDQYMASVEKQLLGTETTRALRAKGVTSIICGLSANDVEQLFLNAGADMFSFKPFPCKLDALKEELNRIIHCERHPQVAKMLGSTNTKRSPSPHRRDGTSTLRVAFVS